MYRFTLPGCAAALGRMTDKTPPSDVNNSEYANPNHIREVPEQAQAHDGHG